MWNKFWKYTYLVVSIVIYTVDEVWIWMPVWAARWVLWWIFFWKWDKYEIGFCKSEKLISEANFTAFVFKNFSSYLASLYTVQYRIPVPVLYYIILVTVLFCLAGTVTSPYHWPSEGVVCFKNVKMRYQPHLPYALKGKPAVSALSSQSSKHFVTVGGGVPTQLSDFHWMM